MAHRRSESYGYESSPPQQTSPIQHTSSAFSASANPNEDWTKISDLAERRRIQNRIAQRNYRKKLKKRLEDLERRAASSSASPEHEQDEFDFSPRMGSIPASSITAKTREAAATLEVRPHVVRVQSDGSDRSLPITEDKAMFSKQHIRQLSMSPPPFSCSPYGAFDHHPTSSIPQIAPLSPPYLSANAQLYQSYIPSNHNYNQHWQAKMSSNIHGVHHEDGMSPFGMSYANLAGSEASYPGSYHEQPLIHTPGLSESFDFLNFGDSSPKDYFGIPRPMTPNAMPLTPPLSFFDSEFI